MTKYIAIDGKGGSGKTYLSVALGNILGAPVLHLDDYGDDFEPFIGIPALIKAINDTRGKVIIFEGVGVFDSRFDRFGAFKVLVETDDEIRHSRLIARDVPRTDRTESDWKRIGEIWSEAEKRYFSDHRNNIANIIVDSIDTDSDVRDIVTNYRNHP